MDAPLLFFCLFQIKVEPPDIRDIDEEEPSGWESPKLVIDLVSTCCLRFYLMNFLALEVWIHLRLIFNQHIGNFFTLTSLNFMKMVR